MEKKPQRRLRYYDWQIQIRRKLWNLKYEKQTIIEKFNTNENKLAELKAQEELVKNNLSETSNASIQQDITEALQKIKESRETLLSERTALIIRVRSIQLLQQKYVSQLRTGPKFAKTSVSNDSDQNQPDSISNSFPPPPSYPPTPPRPKTHTDKDPLSDDD